MTRQPDDDCRTLLSHAIVHDYQRFLLPIVAATVAERTSHIKDLPAAGSRFGLGIGIVGRPDELARYLSGRVGIWLVCEMPVHLLPDNMEHIQDIFTACPNRCTDAT